MSLTRVSSIDGFERAGDTGIPQPRRMSFNPISENEMDRKQSLATELVFVEVSKRTRIVQVSVAIVYCLFAAGVVFGYAAIKPVLIAENVFRELCTGTEQDEGAGPCYQQEVRLNLMFTIAAVSTNVAALPVGTILDKYGPRVCGLMGSVLLMIGTLLFAFAKNIPGDAFTAGYFFLALGGPFIFISSFQLSNTFPQNSGLILALLTGAFDSSSALFLFFRLLFEWSDGKLDTKRLFLMYAAIPIFIFLVQVFVMPSDSYKSVSDVVKAAEDEMGAPTPPEVSIEEQFRFRERRDSFESEIQSLLETSTNAKRAAREEKKNESSGVWGALHGQTALEQVKSPWWILIALFTVVQMTRINYFVATVRSQERVLLGSDSQAKFVNDIFDVALPVGGVLSIPFIGTVLDKTSTPFALGVLVFIATVIGILGCLPYTWAAILNIILFVLYRPFYYTAVSDYSAKVFGFATFGKVYGLIICSAGILNFVQSPLDALTHLTFNSNPIPVNLILLSIAVVVGIALVGFVTWKSQSMARSKLEDEAEHAVDSQMPNADGTAYGTT